MSVKILEVLESAEYNLRISATCLQRELGLEQFRNALYLIKEKDKGLFDDFNEGDLNPK